MAVALQKQAADQTRPTGHTTQPLHYRALFHISAQHSTHHQQGEARNNAPSICKAASDASLEWP